MTFTRVNSIADYGATVLRVSLGIMYLAHAHLKIFTFTLVGTAEFFAKVGFPGWMAYPVTFAELTAGAALIIGWNARSVSLALTPVLIGAAITHWPNGWVHVSVGAGWEYPVFLIAASITLGLMGNGAWALETRTGRLSIPSTSNQRAGI